MHNVIHLISSRFREIARARFTSGNEGLLPKFMLEMLLLHKLEGRVKQDDLWIDSNLKNAQISQTLHVSRYRSRLMFLKQCQLTKEIAGLFKCHNIKELPILIKGISTYGLTEQMHHIRRSVDMDLIYSDPSMLEALLKKIGFVRVNDDGLSDHEFATMARDDLVIDIHKFIPVFGCSEGMMNKASKAESPIFFESFTKLTRDEIPYSELNRDAFAVPSFGGMRVPNVHHQILILCAHIFKNFVHSLFHCSSGVILAELLDVCDLLRHPTFDEERFELLIGSPERQASVDFVGGLISRILGDGKLQELDFASDRVYPKFLLWNGLMELPIQASDYMYYSYSDFTERLDAETFDLQGEEIKKIIPNVEKFNSHGVRQVSSMTLERRYDRLSIQIEMINKPNTLSYDVIEMAFEGIRCCFSFTGTSIELEEQSEGCSFGFTMREEDQGYAIDIEIPVKLFKTPFVSRAGLIICITRWGDGALSTLVPITILVLKP